ncbi:MAG: TonB-dependent receptor [Bacteroidota bacterium]
MKKKFFVVAAVIISSQLLAQQGDTTSHSMDEVVITANKYPLKTSLTGKVLTVITRQQLEQSGGKDLSQLLNEQAGLYISGSNSNPGKDKNVYLRGARVDHTLITIDGVPAYDASGIGGNFDIRNIAIDNIERIEILKGSQSTLYGSDAIAGVINIITKKPITKPVGGYGLVSYGSNKTFRLNTGISGRSGKIDYNAGYTFYTSKGINETISNNATADKDGYTQNNIQAGIGIQANKNIRIQPYIRYSRLNGKLDQGAFTDELDYTYDQKSFQAGVRNEFSFGKTKLTVLYNYTNTNREYKDDSVKSRNGFDIYSRGMYDGSEHFIDAYAFFSLNKNIKLTTGVDYRNSISEQEFVSVSSYGPYSSKYSNDSLKQNRVSLYGALNVTTNAGFLIEAGNRLNISEYGSNDVFNLNPSFLINKKIKLFANLSSAYRIPSLYQLFSEYGNRDLKPESALTAEAGVQYYSADNKITGRAVYFNRHVKDVIFFYTNPSTYASQYINQDKQEDHGIELETSFKLAKNTSIRAFYSYVTGEIITKQNNKDTTYFNLLRRPKNSFGINIGSQVTPRFFISSNLQSFGKREDAYFDSQTYQTVYVTLKSYLLWDVYADYSFCKKKLKVFADLRNITNSKYTEISGFNTLEFNIYGGVRFTL